MKQLALPIILSGAYKIMTSIDIENFINQFEYETTRIANILKDIERTVTGEVDHE
jgi:uncharacterized protein (DUF302 family)